MNQVKGKLEEVSVKTETNNYTNLLNDTTTEEKYYRALCSPEELDGIGSFWRLVLDIDIEYLAKELVEFIVPLYVKPIFNRGNKLLEYRQYQQQFVEKCDRALQELISNPSWQSDKLSLQKIGRVLLLVQNLVDETEVYGVCGPPSVSSLYRGEQVNLKIEPNFGYNANSKPMDLKLYGNMTIFELKKFLAAEIKRTSWSGLKITRKMMNVDIKDNQNGRNLRDIKFKFNERLVVSAKPTPTVESEPLTSMEDILNPKALKCFKEIFEMFSVQSLMYKENCAAFTRYCLNDKCEADDQRVTDLFNKYDLDHDEILQEDDFIRFYTDSAIRKPVVVWQNLKAFGYREDLTKYSEDAEIELQMEDLARNCVTQHETLFNFVFDQLCRNDDLGTQAWNLAIRLPPYPPCYNRLLDFNTMKIIPETGAYDWESLIESTSLYKIIYHLYIIEYLMEEGDEGEYDELLKTAGIDNIKEFKLNWRTEFIKYGGFNHLLKLLIGTTEKGWSKNECTLLYSFVLKIFKNF